MPRITGEVLTISALLNLQDVEAAASFGITPSHFLGFDEEYKWLQWYLKNYGEQPSRAAFRAAFPTFHLTEHEDLRSAVDSLLDRYHQKRLTEAIDSATQIAKEDVRAAWETIQAVEPIFTSSSPRSLVTDMTFFDTYQDEQAYIELPVPTLQRVTGGIGHGQLWYVAARTNHGKSAHLCEWVSRAVRNGHRVKFYSLEMTEMEVRARIHAIMARAFKYKNITSFGILHREVDPHEYKTFVGELSDKLAGELHIHTPAEGLVSPGVIAASARDYDLVVVDHVGLLRPDGGGHSTDDWRVVAKNSNSLKEIALSTSTPVVAAAQINREGDRGKNPPDTVNLSGSDALGQDADVVVTMRTRRATTACWLPKNRNGPKAKWYTKFDPNKGNFKEVKEEEAELLEIEAEDD